MRSSVLAQAMVGHRGRHSVERDTAPRLERGAAARGSPWPRRRRSRTCGASALIAVATPAINPPPPIATRMVVEVRHLVEDFEPDRALSGHHQRVGERVEVDGAGRLGEGQRRLVRLVPEPPVTMRVAAPQACSFSILAGETLVGRKTVVVRPPRSPARAVAIPWLPPDAATMPLREPVPGRGEQPVCGAPCLERAGDLQQLELQVRIAPGATGSFACDASTTGVRRTWPSIRAAASRTSAIPITIPPWAKLGSASSPKGRPRTTWRSGTRHPRTRKDYRRRRRQPRPGPARSGRPGSPLCLSKGAPGTGTSPWERSPEPASSSAQVGGSPFRRGHARLLACVHR